MKVKIIEKWLIYSLLMLFPFKCLFSQEQAIQNEQMAHAHFAAQSYNYPLLFYEKFLTNTNSKWQQAILLYNLATIKLAQKQWEEARKMYRLIHLDSINSSHLLVMKLTNQGTTYLNQLDLLQDSIDLDQQSHLLHRSRQYFIVAQQAACTMQPIENSQNKRCVYPFELTWFLKRSARQLIATRQKQRELLIDKDFSFFLLIKGLKRTVEWLDSVPLSDQKAYVPFSSEVIQSLSPLWQALKSQNPADLPLIESAFAEYSSAIKNMQNGQWEKSRKELILSKDKLVKWQPGSNTTTASYSEILLDYNLLFAQNILTEDMLRSLIQSLHSVDSNAAIGVSIQYLNSSLDYLKIRDEWLAKFYLYASFYTLDDFILQSTSSVENPIQALQQALEKGKKSLQLYRLINLETEKIPEEAKQLISHYQQLAIEKAQPFIALSIKQQEMQFQKLGSLSCQQSPWKQVIPLFEKGDQNARIALKDLFQKEDAALAEQEQMVFSWQQALNLLQSPSQEDPSNSESQNTAKDIHETFQSLEEMELNDVFKPSPTSKKEILEW